MNRGPRAVPLARLRSQRGYKLAAALVSAVILAAGLAISIEGLYHGSRAVSRARHLAIASALARGEMERLRAEGVPRAGRHELAHAGLLELPEGQAFVTVTRHSATLRKATVTIRWEEPAGPRRSGELVTLLPAKGGPR